ncbi:MAG: tRNA preQ1(34) S-adenosylmethionine ribosyltransferase-isomerase QueA, partial [Phycisphaerales bacterium]|nr:tRNA preQ1(34) S-adenosylmethionine ribosyltransferase-isomerase QueA [Phycisphaerales bacterium]
MSRLDMLPTDHLDYDLPPELIATHPATPRDASRLMVLHRSDPSRVEHVRFADLGSYVRGPDVLVRNVTRVLPARFEGIRLSTGGRLGGLFLAESGPGRWQVLLRSNGRLRPGDIARIGDTDPIHLRLIEKADEGWIVQVEDPAGQPLVEAASVLLASRGLPPLPPYILAARRAREGVAEDPSDPERYQTVYAAPDEAGSVAAPTAGLHFTPDLIASLTTSGVHWTDVVLDIGAGTFKPIEAASVEAHAIHDERIEVPGTAIRAIRDSRAAGGRSVVIGTTSVRALESLPHPLPADVVDGGLTMRTRLLITPGFAFRHTDALVTNFHLPRSTLLMLVCAFADRELILEAYAEAVRSGYRFYSYGD